MHCEQMKSLIDRRHKKNRSRKSFFQNLMHLTNDERAIVTTTGDFPQLPSETWHADRQPSSHARRAALFWRHLIGLSRAGGQSQTKTSLTFCNNSKSGSWKAIRPLASRAKNHASKREHQSTNTNSRLQLTPLTARALTGAPVVESFGLPLIFPTSFQIFVSLFQRPFF